MKTLKSLMVVMFVLLVTFLLVWTASAQRHGGGHGGSHGGGHGGGGRSHHGGYAHGHSHGYYRGYGYGWWGYPYWWNYGYYPYHNLYYDPDYYEGYGGLPVLPQGATPSEESGKQQPSYWHFCQDPEGYYPYVKDCPGGWMRVVPPKPNAVPPSKLGAPVLPILPSGKKPEK